jgi:hypothetical protein
MSQLPILRFVDVPAGRIISGASQVTLSWFDEQNTREQYKLRQLRVGLYQAANGVRYTALLTVPGGIEIGPIDIPFRFNVEGPVNLQFTSDSANTVNQKIVCTFHDMPDSPNLYGATYLVLDTRTEAAFPNWTHIPPWVQALTIYSGATVTLYDHLGAAIGTAVGPQLVARPRAAEYLKGTAESGTVPVLFHY